MLLTVKEITKTITVFSDGETEVRIDNDQIDKFAYLTVGREIEFASASNEVPYSISSQRRADIREHHAEEARCGNL